MRVAYWLAQSELLGSGSYGEMGQDDTRQADAIRPDERSGERRKGKDKQARPKSKTCPGARADGYYYERAILSDAANCRVEGLPACARRVHVVLAAETRELEARALE